MCYDLGPFPPMFCKAPPSQVISVNDSVSHPTFRHSPSAGSPVIPSDSPRFICSLPSVSLLQLCPSAVFIALTFESPADFPTAILAQAGIFDHFGLITIYSTSPIIIAKASGSNGSST